MHDGTLSQRRFRNVENQERNVTNALTLPGDPTAEARDLVHLAALPMLPTDNVKARIGRAARVLGLGYSRAKQAWYGQPAAWRAAEMDAMRARFSAALEARLAREEAALEALRARVAAIAGSKAA